MKKQNRAYLIKVDGTIQYLDHRPTLSEAQQLVGGYICLLTTRLCRVSRLTIFGDEEGNLKRKLFNQKASDLLSYRVVGDILVLEGWKTLG